MSNLVSEARLFAADAHMGQLYGLSPYMVHLQAVVDVLQRFGINEPEMLAAGWLHDVLEDTSTEPHMVASAFGPVVSTLVWAVTDEPGANRKERKRKTYPKTRSVVGATTLKLADRIANVEHSFSMRSMYCKEHPEFREALYQPDVVRERAMWRHLDGLLMTRTDQP